MKLVFFYVSYKNGFGHGIPWDKKQSCENNYYVPRVQEEGYFHILKGLSELDYLDEVIIVIESRDNPGYIELTEKLKIAVVPDINDTKSFIEEKDVLWIRGGWKHWHDYLVEMKEAGHWLMIYAANTGRQKWPFWDVILDDLDSDTYIDGKGRLIYDFRKPIAEDIFKVENKDALYDICIGASRVHDKKGQWRAIEALADYTQRKGRKLKAILPGPWAGGSKTNGIKRMIAGRKLNVKITDGIIRKEMSEIMNQSKVFIHLGSHGQGDRGVLEAMACGCNIIIGYPSYHSPWIFDGNNTFIKVARNANNTRAVSDIITSMVYHSAYHEREDIANFYYENAGLKQQAIPRMKKLLDFFKDHSPSDIRDFKI